MNDYCAAAELDDDRDQEEMRTESKGGKSRVGNYDLEHAIQCLEEWRARGGSVSSHVLERLNAALDLDKVDPDDAIRLAKKFHETYERLAPDYNYETRAESAVPWEDVPEANRKLMIATCAELLTTERLPIALELKLGELAYLAQTAWPREKNSVSQAERDRARSTIEAILLHTVAK